VADERLDGKRSIRYSAAMANDGAWWRSGVFYEIYVRSFQDANGDGIGDLAGIVERLDYLNDGTPRSLGVDAIWLTPIHPSPMYDFGYDVSDYCAVDPRFGGLADVERLLAEAHRRGIRVILDLVPNHTSHEHRWFRDSLASRASAHRDWYIWRDPAPGGAPPNNWMSAFGGPAWTLDEGTGQYYLHSFLPQQPDLNYRNPAVAQAMEDVIRFWLDRGVDGFRVDVIHKMIKDEELRDNPSPDAEDGDPVRHYGGQRHIHDEDRPEVHEIIRAWRRILERYGERMMVGEVYLFEPERLARYYGNGSDELNLAFNFRFLWSPWEADEFRRRVDEIERALPAGAQPTYVLSSHDAPRHRTRFDDARHGERRARVAALMLLTLRGTPFLYYGDEIGMRDVAIPSERICDPVGKRFAGLGRDPERTPMQWSDRRNAGFSDAPQTWLPVADDFPSVNVARQLDDPNSLLSFYRRLIWYRKGSPALTAGSYRLVEAAPDTFVYLREHADQRLLIALNFAGEPRPVTIPTPGAGTIVQGTESGREPRVSSAVKLEPAEALLIELDRGH